MCQFDNSLSLDELLKHCSDRKSSCHECGWQEFLKRYKMFIYNAVIKQCLKYNSKKIKSQLQETVDDIISDVFNELIKNNFHALQAYRGGEDEKRFFAFLATICRFKTIAYSKRINKVYVIDFQDHEVGSTPNFVTHQRTYEEIVKYLTNDVKRMEKNIERNIHVFMLNTLGDLNEESIMKHPCLRDIGPTVIRNETSRLRKQLEGKQNHFEIFAADLNTIQQSSFEGINFGTALAILERKLKYKNEPELDIGDAVWDEFRNLEQQYITILKNQNHKEIFESIPLPCCEEQSFFLNGHDDFFIALFLLNEKKTYETNNFQRFFYHLNQCYFCFEEFSKVFRDYSNYAS